MAGLLGGVGAGLGNVGAGLGVGVGGLADVSLGLNGAGTTTAPPPPAETTAAPVVVAPAEPQKTTEAPVVVPSNVQAPPPPPPQPTTTSVALPAPTDVEAPIVVAAPQKPDETTTSVPEAKETVSTTAAAKTTPAPTTSATSAAKTTAPAPVTTSTPPVVASTSTKATTTSVPGPGASLVGVPLVGNANSKTGQIESAISSIAGVSLIPTTLQTSVIAGITSASLDAATLGELFTAPAGSVTSSILVADVAQTASPTPTQTNGIEAQPQSGGIPMAATIAIAIAGGIGAIALIATIILLCRRHKKRKESNDLVLMGLDSMYEAGKPTASDEKDARWNQGLEQYHSGTSSLKQEAGSKYHPYA